MEEKNKIARPDKHEKVKNGKPPKLEKKGVKKLDGVKKHDSVKKEKKAEGAKTAKKHADIDDDAPLVRFKLKYFLKYSLFCQRPCYCMYFGWQGWKCQSKLKNLCQCFQVCMLEKTHFQFCLVFSLIKFI